MRVCTGMTTWGCVGELSIFQNMTSKTSEPKGKARVARVAIDIRCLPVKLHPMAVTIGGGWS